MDFIILIVQLTAGNRHNLLPPDWVKLLDRRVVDMTAILTTQAGRPHLAIGTFQAKEFVFFPETQAAYAGHDRPPRCQPWNSSLIKNDSANHRQRQTIWKYLGSRPPETEEEGLHTWYRSV